MAGAAYLLAAFSWCSCFSERLVNLFRIHFFRDPAGILPGAVRLVTFVWCGTMGWWLAVCRKCRTGLRSLNRPCPSATWPEQGCWRSYLLGRAGSRRSGASYARCLGPASSMPAHGITSTLGRARTDQGAIRGRVEAPWRLGTQECVPHVINTETTARRRH